MKFNKFTFALGCLCFLFTNMGMAEIKLDTPAWQKVLSLGSSGSYSFLFLGDDKTDQGRKMLTILETTKKNMLDKKATIVKALPADPKEQSLISFFKIKDDPTVIVVAPNGAITGFFTVTLDKKMLSDSLVSLKEAEIIKHMQDGKIVFLCFHKNTGFDASTIKADINAVADNFKGAVKVLYSNSTDQTEKQLSDKFQVSANQTTVFIVAPPGRAVAKLEGADITKENLMRALVTTCGGGGCGSGSGSSSGCK